MHASMDIADQPSPFCALPDDVLLSILTHLPVPAILRLRQTCHLLRVTTKLRSVWHEALHRQILDEDVPVPVRRPGVHAPMDTSTSGVDYNALSQPELEDCARRALLLRANWLAPEPQLTRRTLVDPTICLRDAPPAGPPDAPAYRERVLHNLSLSFLPGYAGRYVITGNLVALESVGAGGNPATARVWCIEVWDTVDVTREEREREPMRKARCVARMIRPRVVGWKANKVPGSTVALAIGQHGPDLFTLYALNLSASDPANAFIALATVHGCLIPLLLQEHTLITRNMEHNLTLSSISPAGDAVHPIARLADPDTAAPPQPVKAVLAHPHCIVLVREQSIEVYPPAGAPAPEDSPCPVAAPLATHRLPWRLNTARLTMLPCARSHPAHLRPLELVARFDSWYPWPVNMLHHLRLLPDPLYAPPASGTTGLGAAPYDPRPVAVAAWASPIELFAPSALSLEHPARTVLFLDSGDTPSAHAQRVAAHVLAPYDGGSAGAGAARGVFDPAVAAQEAPAGPMRAMVFAAHEGAAWVNVALEEEQGVVALASGDGKVDVWEYAPMD